MQADSRNIIKRYCIALTGGIASGKSTVASILRDFGFVVIDADKLTHALISQGGEALKFIREEFGEQLFEDGGRLNRSAVRQRLTSDPTFKTRYESILHPLIEKSFIHELKVFDLDQKPKFFFYEASLIFERGREQDFREVWTVYCEPDTQLARLQQRSNFSRVEAEGLIRQQLSGDLKRQKSAAVVDTGCTIDELRNQVRMLVEARLSAKDI
jgi:dephospho-CoA kinase